MRKPWSKPTILGWIGTATFMVLALMSLYLPAGASRLRTHARTSGNPYRPAVSAPPVQGISAESIIARMIAADAERDLALQRYTVTRNYHAVSTRLKKEATMEAQVRFESPATKRFTILFEEGSDAIRERVFRHMIKGEVEFLDPEVKRRSALSTDNYQFTLAGQEAISGRPCYVLHAQPKRKEKFLINGRLWIDAADFALVRLRGSPAKMPSFWTRKLEVERDYQKIRDFWLPVKDEAQTQLLAFGPAHIVVQHSNYRLEAAAIRCPPSASQTRR